MHIHLDEQRKGTVMRLAATTLSMTLAILASPALAQPQQDIENDMRSCRAVNNTAARLACYDGIADSLGARAVQREADTKRAIAAAKEKAAKDFGRRADTAGEEAKIAADVPDDTKAIIEASKEPDQITANVTRVEENGTGKVIVYLDNEQVWIETSASRFRGKPKTGEKATINRAGLGWYRMKFSKTYGVMAVRRAR